MELKTRLEQASRNTMTLKGSREATDISFSPKETQVKYNEAFNHDEDKIEALNDKINIWVSSLEDNIETLNNKISGLQWDTAQDTNKLNDRVKFLEEESKMLALNDRVNTLERTSKSLDNRCFDNIDGIKALNDKCDDLEAKNFQIKSDLDKLINGEETITLGELREAKNWEDVGKLINKGVK